MKLALFIRDLQLKSDRKLISLLKQLESCEVYEVGQNGQLAPGTDILLSVGGDGTLLSAAQIVAGTDIPVLGVNLGRMGFLSENRPENIAAQLLAGEYSIESREMLAVRVSGIDREMYALNEFSVSRGGAAMLGVEVELDGEHLPTYWADGLLVATSSGSTAYSLSVGGPICMPEAKVLVISPIAPHNLNLRPLVVPSSSSIRVSLRSRDPEAMVMVDNMRVAVSSDMIAEISLAQFSLGRVRLCGSHFINALHSKLLWGEDVRNETEI